MTGIIRQEKVNIMDLISSSGSGGGPDKTIILSAAKTNRDNFNTFVVYFKKKDDANNVIKKRAEEKGIIIKEIITKSKIDISSLIKLYKLIKINNIHILHTHGYKADISGYIISYFTKIKLVTTSHGWTNYNNKIRIYNNVALFITRYFDLVIAVSDKIKDELISRKIPKNRIVMIHNGVDTEYFTPEKKIKDIRKEIYEGDGPIVGIIGRLSPEKDILTYLKAAKIVLNRINNIMFAIIGEGPERESLISFIAQSKMEKKVKLLGFRSDILSIYKSIDILVLSSITEGLPNVILEAQAMGVPIVSTDVGGVREIITHKYNGLLVNPQEPEALATAIIEILTEKSVEIKFKKAGRENVVKRFSFDKRVAQIESLYNQLMDPIYG